MWLRLNWYRCTLVGTSTKWALLPCLSIWGWFGARLAFHEVPKAMLKKTDERFAPPDVNTYYKGVCCNKKCGLDLSPINRQAE